MTGGSKQVAPVMGASSGFGRMVAEQGRTDVVVQNAGHMAYGPSEAFTPEQPAELYNIDVLGAQGFSPGSSPRRSQSNCWSSRSACNSR